MHSAPVTSAKGDHKGGPAPYDEDDFEEQTTAKSSVEDDPSTEEDPSGYGVPGGKKGGGKGKRP